VVLLAACLVLIAAASGGDAAVGTAFTYRGRLDFNGAPANGHFDFEFRLSTAPSGGVQMGPAVTVLDVTLADVQIGPPQSPAFSISFQVTHDGSDFGDHTGGDDEFQLTRSVRRARAQRKIRDDPTDGSSHRGVARSATGRRVCATGGATRDGESSYGGSVPCGRCACFAAARGGTPGAALTRAPGGT
jgi:hypothetical protein